jgi:hypothetical protein
MNLSPNFSLHELTKSDTALRNDLDKHPRRGRDRKPALAL